MFIKYLVVVVMDGCPARVGAAHTAAFDGPEAELCEAAVVVTEGATWEWCGIHLGCKRVGFGCGDAVETKFGGSGCGADPLRTRARDWFTYLDEAVWGFIFSYYI